MEEDVRKAIFQMKHNKGPGPDGFPVEFYKNFWDISKVNLMELFNAFHNRQLELFKLNFWEIILLLEIKDTEMNQKYMSICLLNVNFKIFTKVVTIRLNSVTDHVIRPTQTTYMKGWYILDGVVTLRDTFHKLHHKKIDGVIFKVDFEKAYDKVKWLFLQQVLRMKGFSET